MRKPPGSPLSDLEGLIASGPRLEAALRLGIVHSHYWERLVRVLSFYFPLLRALVGEELFLSHVALPYLMEHPPRHWALKHLGDQLPPWLARRRRKRLWVQMARMDLAATRALWIPHLSPLDFSLYSPEEVLQLPLRLQTSCALFKHPRPLLLYRSKEHEVVRKELDRGEYLFLRAVQRGLTLEGVCASFEERGGPLLGEIEEFLPVWVSDWVLRGWLCLRY